ncbi:MULTISPECIES: SDR family NAD(P)-dependent oxidoreductase [unclassified Amycolatopsis]|uniref:SDR family NAD(P)-dependent oxidoreductase n=1 Tax=unclassified Amycolatopsis TaxID=2618356 RepID=UPI00287431A7|nr:MULTISPECIES: SDR family NAD(P)-dependent oxidoreductase [unclassified Amycolatopsis]MDS0133177.1 SDR family NAD(P)-dependent oxidoreductase [Amycolatopsis sp. 505]MDS0141998.1 SDR family NAD(P)-dependent oxidoreductase [Amycolatopsis sp. CM201R]
MSLAGKVAVVTGATRGCGRAIAVELGRAGATVYVTGRTTRETASPMKRPETIEETGELVEAAGGKAVVVRCDFTSQSDVDALKARIESEVDGIDILVDDVWGGDMYFHFDAPYWETPLDDALKLTHNALDTHLIALHKLLPLVIARRGLVLEVTDGDNDDYVGAGFPYYLAKCGIRALGRALGAELKEYDCVGFAVTPGFLRSESMLDIFEVTEDNWRDAVGKIAPVDFKISETPYLLARGVAALAQDPDVARFAGQTVASWTLMKEYGYTDVDGDRPDFGRWLTEVRHAGKDPATTPPDDFR